MDPNLILERLFGILSSLVSWLPCIALIIILIAVTNILFSRRAKNQTQKLTALAAPLGFVPRDIPAELQLWFKTVIGPPERERFLIETWFFPFLEQMKAQELLSSVNRIFLFRLADRVDQEDDDYRIYLSISDLVPTETLPRVLMLPRRYDRGEGGVARWREKIIGYVDPRLQPPWPGAQEVPFGESPIFQRRFVVYADYPAQARSLFPESLLNLLERKSTCLLAAGGNFLLFGEEITESFSPTNPEHLQRFVQQAYAILELLTSTSAQTGNILVSNLPNLPPSIAPVRENSRLSSRGFVFWMILLLVLLLPLLVMMFLLLSQPDLFLP